MTRPATPGLLHSCVKVERSQNTEDGFQKIREACSRAQRESLMKSAQIAGFALLQVTGLADVMDIVHKHLASIGNLAGANIQLCDGKPGWCKHDAGM